MQTSTEETKSIETRNINRDSENDDDLKSITSFRKVDSKESITKFVKPREIVAPVVQTNEQQAKPGSSIRYSVGPGGSDKLNRSVSFLSPKRLPAEPVLPPKKKETVVDIDKSDKDKKKKEKKKQEIILKGKDPDHFEEFEKIKKDKSSIKKTPSFRKHEIILRTTESSEYINIPTASNNSMEGSTSKSTNSKPPSKINTSEQKSAPVKKKDNSLATILTAPPDIDDDKDKKFNSWKFFKSGFGLFKKKKKGDEGKGEDSKVSSLNPNPLTTPTQPAPNRFRSDDEASSIGDVSVSSRSTDLYAPKHRKLKKVDSFMSQHSRSSATSKASRMSMRSNAEGRKKRKEELMKGSKSSTRSSTKSRGRSGSSVGSPGKSGRPPASTKGTAAYKDSVSKANKLFQEIAPLEKSVSGRSSISQENSTVSGVKSSKPSPAKPIVKEKPKTPENVSPPQLGLQIKEEAVKIARERRKTADTRLILPYDVLVERNEARDFDGLKQNELESHLSETEFEIIFSKSFEEFYSLPAWKQVQQRKQMKLF